jgi:hypothetical protein
MPPRRAPAAVNPADVPPDTRHYRNAFFKNKKRLHAFCTAFQVAPDGKHIPCTYHKRVDHHNEALARGERHICDFTPQAGIEAFLRDGTRIHPGDAWEPISGFLASTNTPIALGESRVLRDLLRDLFVHGFQAGATNPKADVEDEFDTYCPALKATAIRARICEHGQRAQVEMRQLLQGGQFSCMTLDGGQVGSTHLFITNLVSSQLKICFTAGIHEMGPVKHTKFRDFLKGELEALQQNGITVSTVVSDGATYQTKALNFEDKASIQAKNPGSTLLSRLLFIPCLCHRLNNAYHRLVRGCRVYARFIGSLRRLAIFCRKPAQVEKLGRRCPQFIETRWLYDHRILTFLLEHEDQINALDDRPSRVTPKFRAFSRLLKPLWELVTALEASDVPLAQAYGRLSSVIREFKDISLEDGDQGVRDVFDLAADIVAELTLDSSHNLIQLAYVLTPAGRQAAQRQLRSLVGQQPPARNGFNLELMNFESQFADHGIAEATDDGDEEPPPESAAEEDISDPELPVRGPAVTEVVVVSVPPSSAPSHYLAHRAREGLMRILRQFHVSDQEAKETDDIFQVYLNAPEVSLGLASTGCPSTYCWLSATCVDPRYALLAEIALRLEPAICSEAPSERSIGQQRRFLMPHRTRTKLDLLLSRTIMEEKHHNQERMHVVPGALRERQASHTVDV